MANTMPYFQYGIYTGALVLARSLFFIFAINLLTVTTKPTELAIGIERLLDPFHHLSSRLGVLAHDVALIITGALRFVPVFKDDIEQVSRAQISRCADFDKAKLYRPIKSIKSILPLIIPLFRIARHRADELTPAMEARCYVKGSSRTKLIVLRARLHDYLVVAGATLLLVAVIRYL